MKEDDIQNLFYLVHDKSHIMRPGSVTPAIQSLVESSREPQKNTLYRGMCKEDVALLGSMFDQGVMFKTWPSCLSFSESKRIAAKFAKSYGTNSVLRICSNRTKRLPEGLNVYGSLEKVINRQDESEMDILEMASEEKEWIFCQPRVIPVSRKVRADGMVLYTVSLVTL